MRILYSSNGPWCASGYGVQGASLVPRLQALPEVEEVAIFAWYGLQGGTWEWNGTKIYPGYRDGYGNDVYKGHCLDFKADVCITLIDTWVLNNLGELIDPTEWWAWLSVDTEPVSDKVVESLKTTTHNLTWCPWAKRMLEEKNVLSTCVPLGVEEGIFKVLDKSDTRNTFREETFGKDVEFVVTTVSANKGQDDRKAHGYQLQAFARFAKDKPGVRFYMHTTPGMDYQGVDIPAIAKALGIEDKVVFPNPYYYAMGYPSEWMSSLYNSSDVYLGAAKSEGFGIPLIEAQACGIPVITSDFSSQPELVRWGMIVPLSEKEWSVLGGWRGIPSVDKLHVALEETYENWRTEHNGEWDKDKRSHIQDKIHTEYGWDTIVEECWHPLIRGDSNVPSTEITVSVDGTGGVALTPA